MQARIPSSLHFDDAPAGLPPGALRPALATLLAALLFTAALVAPVALHAQDIGGWTQPDDEEFNEALELYEQAEYLEAASLFQDIDTPEAILFTGKSYYSAGHYHQSLHHLNRLPGELPGSVRDEAHFTRALSHFQLGDFARSLDRLVHINETAGTFGTGQDARRIYETIMNYLTLEQRRQAFHRSDNLQVQEDLVAYALEWVDWPTSEQLVDMMVNTIGPLQDPERIEEIRSMVPERPDDTLQPLEPTDAIERRHPPRFGPAPEGMIYNIGVALPALEQDAPEHRVSQSLFHGFHVAAERFNQRNEDRRIILHHANTAADSLDGASALSHLVWQHNIDLMLGPLFSEEALEMADAVEQYGVPMVPPLANADSINIANPYIFQPNPTFRKRGRAMARFAINELEMDTVAVIAESDADGLQEAFAFREEVQLLGGHVSKFIVENFRTIGYDPSEVTPWFSSDEEYIDEEEYELVPADGLFLPFTTEGAPTLLDLVLTDLEAMRSELAVLGNQQLGGVDIRQSQRERFDIYYTETFHESDDEDHLEEFEEEYRNMSGHEPDMYAYVGHDIASQLFQTLEQVYNPANLKHHLRGRDTYEGLIQDIRYDADYINDRLQIMKHSPDGRITYEQSVEDQEDDGDADEDDDR